jgi:putative nucleotidyltransferase with HDIG domain
VLSSKQAFKSLLAITSHDYYTYTHSVNVCAYCVALGQTLGYDEETLNNFGLGALLHDLGKSAIDPSIINKPGRLTSEEFELIKTHPVRGVEIVESLQGIPPASIEVVRQHHEKLDGSGYPDGRKGNDIHPWAKVALLVDVFDALTTNRPYRDAMNTFNAFELIKNEFQGQYEPKLFRSLVMLLKK